MTETEYAHLHLTLPDDELSVAKAESEATSVPLDGVILLRLVDIGIRQGQIDPNGMMSAQEHLKAIADKLERDGVFDDDVPHLVAKLRILSNFASTRLVAADPY